MASMRKLERQAQDEVARWTHPEGTRVCYRRDNGTALLTATRGGASVMGGTAVIWLEGVSGCVALERVSPVEEQRTGPGVGPSASEAELLNACVEAMEALSDPDVAHTKAGEPIRDRLVDVMCRARGITREQLQAEYAAAYREATGAESWEA